MFKLVIQDDEGKTTVVPLIRDEITIGRKEGNTIRLTERNVSRRHARILRANGAVAIEDLGSYNGVRVNGTRIAQRTALTVSDRVQIGDYLIELKAEGAEQADQYGEAKTQPIERVEPLARGNGVAAGAPAMAPPMMAAPMTAAPAAQVALADTDPGVARAVSAPAPLASSTGHARMAVLSSNFAGREFELLKPQMVVGRTDDNDIVINHRSISRNHAKVVREPDTGRYTISDLQSSNGVRVNGEEYGKVELRRGDIIDLGHVRLRFIEPGEDFVFARDAQIVDVPGGGSGKGLMIALLALLLVGGGIGVVLATSGGKSSAQANNDGADSGAPAAIPMVPDAMPEVAPPDVIDASAPPLGVPEHPDVSRALEDARTALEAGRWIEADKAARRALEKDPGNEQAKALAAQAKDELANEIVYRKLNDAVRTKDHAGVATQFEKIGEDSFYKEKARPAHDRLKAEYVALTKRQAKNLARQGKCKDLKKLSEQAGRVWSEAGDAAAAEECQEPVSANPTPRPDRPKPEGPKPDGGTPPVTPPTTPPANVESLVADSESLARTGQFARAMKSCEQALAADPRHVRALTACVIAACNLKLASKAKNYRVRLQNQPDRYAQTRQICLRNGIDLE